MFEQWILPIFYKKDEQGEKNTLAGQCVWVNNYLITAAHVVDKINNEPYVRLRGEELSLVKEEAIAYSYTPQINKLEDYEDYAIFHVINKLHSPLHLSEIISNNNMTCFYNKKQQRQEICDTKRGSIWETLDQEPILTNEMRFLCSSAKLDAVLSSKLFQCEISPVLSEGDSGCPIMINNNVVGILLGAFTQNINIHLFQSAAYIKKILDQCLANSL
jgi:hypothetical protein